MHTVTALSILALAGSALAMPAPQHHHRDLKIVYETQVVTVIVTPGAPQPTSAPEPPAPKPEQPAPAPVEPTSTVVVVETPSYAPAPAKTEAPASSGPDYMATVNEWRKRLGKPELKYSSTLEANAKKTCVDGNGQMVHQLNPGSYGQVLAPGQPDDFFHVFVGGWLCERPDMPGMDGICAEQSQGWAYNGQTGHADILTSTDYTQIGCAQAIGIWGCDLGF